MQTPILHTSIWTSVSTLPKPPSPDYRLSMLLEENAELRATVARIAKAALSAENPGLRSRCATEHELVLARVRAAVEAALADLSREHNVKHAFQRNVPSEVWCLIWDRLPIGDRISVARVCHSWRDLALSRPRLWCNLDFRCRGASEHAGDGYDNLAQILLSLSRTGVYPLTLCADVGFPSRQPAVAALRDALTPHVARLVSVRFRTDDSNARYLFFRGGLERLPALRTLLIESTPCASERIDPLFLSAPWGPSGLLELRKLDMRGGDDVPAQPLPVLVSLDFQYEGVEYLLEFMRQAPKLRRLHLRLRSSEGLSSPSELYLCPRVRACAVPGLCFEASELDPRTEAVMLAMFGADERQEIRFNYECVAHDLGSPHVFCGLQILRHIKSPRELYGIADYSGPDWSHRLTLTVLGDGDKKRTLDVPWTTEGEGHLQDAGFFELCDYLESPPRSITVDARLWTLFKLNAAIAAGLQKLTLHLVATEDNLKTSVPRGADFVSLEEVRLQGQVPRIDPAIDVQVSSAVTFLKSLRPRGRLPRLVLSRVALSGVVEELRDVCEKIVYQ